MGPGEPPKGTPNGAPRDFHRNTLLYGIDRFVSMHTLKLQHSSREPTIMGPPGAPSLGTYSTSVLVFPYVFNGLRLFLLVLKTQFISETRLFHYFDYIYFSDDEMEVFARNHPVPFTKMLTFFRREAFDVEASYMGDIPSNNRSIGKLLAVNEADILFSFALMKLG